MKANEVVVTTNFIRNRYAVSIIFENGEHRDSGMLDIRHAFSTNEHVAIGEELEADEPRRRQISDALVAFYRAAYPEAEVRTVLDEDLK